MRVLYFDCFSGVSGDMILGSLLDAGLSAKDLKSELSKLDLKGYVLESRKITKQGISGTKIEIKIDQESPESRKIRRLGDILKLIESSRLNQGVKNKSGEVFKTLARAEASVHNSSIEEVHFHEVGAVDSIVDIVGSIIGIKLLDVDRVISSPLHLGSGFTECSHGRIPLPAPATMELTKNIPVYSNGIEGELTTPTGAAVLASVCDSFQYMPSVTPFKIGYGAGNKEFLHPNLLRAIIGNYTNNEKRKENFYKSQDNIISIIETNIDDMNPEFHQHLMNLCFKQGALEVYFTPVYMKKNRPGTLITVLTPFEQADSITDIILKNTTSIGVRKYEAERTKLERKNVTINTPIGKASLKLGFSDNILYNWTPEYESALALAKKTGKTLKEVYNIINQEFLNQKEDV